jgi:hypothetical protein
MPEPADMRDYAETPGTIIPDGWLDDPASRAYVRALGARVSDTLALYRDGVLSRFARFAPTDLLPDVGVARQLERAPGESTADYRVRLQRAFEIHGDRTTAQAYRHALEPIGVDPDTVTVYGEEAVGEHDWYSEVFVFVDSTAGPWTALLWDSGWNWDDGTIWDIDGLTVAQLAFARRMIRRWKWAGAYPTRLFIQITGTVWTPGDPWTPAAWHTAGEAIPIKLGRTWDEDLEYSGVPDLWDSGWMWDDNFPETE